ncbi:MAG TPA: tetratricopeptide repeat protein [Candidatus Limnocylindria bacterium]|jgi:cytochrome c-type biogenesis protein CcmH/NrfG|nr:tetratricopeptide repeat protein [Candidatus Limnocylindria bacterium]
MSYLLFTTLFLAGLAFAVRPLLVRRAVAWPVEAPDTHDDVARAVSSLRDLEFARAAGTIAPADHERLRGLLERGAFVRERETRSGPAPWRTLALAAVLAGIAVVLVVIELPQAAGDRAPGETITGTVPAGPTTPQLEARAKATPRDVPTLLALADAYVMEDRVAEAVAVYQAVLAIDKDSVPALNGIGFMLFRSGEYAGARLAVDRVLTLRPRDADALFLKGLIQYRTEDWRGAVDTWQVFLDVGEFHPGAPMVRPLYDDARKKAGL